VVTVVHHVVQVAVVVVNILRHAIHNTFCSKTLEQKQVEYVAGYQFPDKIISRLKSRYDFTDEDIDRIVKCMKVYFLTFTYHKTYKNAMPSVIVDELWHLFILYTREYDEFCKKAFGFKLHHVPDDIKSEEEHKQKTKTYDSTYGCIVYMNKEHDKTLKQHGLYDDDMEDIYHIDKDYIDIIERFKLIP
jgi:hypothetical protein